MIEEIILREGAAICGGVRTERVLGMMTGEMLERWEKINLPYAVIAVFPFRPGLSPSRLPMHAREGSYVHNNKNRLKRACEELERLYPSNTFIPKGNAWPLPAVQAARLAGIGDIGAHGMLITRDFGSLVTIGAVFTDLEVAERAEGGYCRLCGECVKACPTGALRLGENERAYTKEKCISYISQHVKDKTELERQWVEASGLDWGCDVCQLACPENARFL